MICNAKTVTLIAAFASAGLIAQTAHAAPVGSDLIERGFWDDVADGWNEFKGGFKDGFDAEQARPLAPEEVGHKRANKQDFSDVLKALHKMGVNSPKKAAKKLQARDLAERGFWDDVADGWDEFKGGFKDGFNAEQARPLAPEEVGHKRANKQDFDDVVKALRKMGVNASKKTKLQARDSGALVDIGTGIGKGFGDLKDDLFGGFDKVKADADRIFHPVVPAEEKDKRDSWEDDAGNVVGALAGWGTDHIGRISFKRDSWEDDLGNAVGAGAGWVTDHVGRIDPTDLIPSKGLKKAISRRGEDDDSDLLA